MRTLTLTLLLLTVTLMSSVMADSINNNGPDSAICSSFSGSNNTCGECIAQGCFYCDNTETGIGGLCVSSSLQAKTMCNATSLISSAASLTQCRATQPDLYEDLSAFIPITTGGIGLIGFLLALWFVRPNYAPSTPSAPQEVLIMAPAEGHDQPLLGPTSRWVLIKQQLTRERVKHHCRRSGCGYKLLIVIVLVVVMALSIVAVSGRMWSIQVNGNLHDKDGWNSAKSAIAYDGYGVHTITRDPNDSNHKELIFRWSHYTCDTVRGDQFIRCSLHRVVSSATHSIAIMALTCICIAMFQMLWSIIRCRSLNSLSVKFMSLAAISHLVAVLIYAGGSFLLQSRVYRDSEITNTTSPSSPYHLFLGVNWNVSVAAFILNVILLIPLTRAHIHAIPKPDNKRGCCCKKQPQQPQQQQEEEPAMGVTFAVPIEQPSYNLSMHNPYATGATSYTSPSYQYGTIQTTSAQPAHGSHGFPNEI